MSLLLECLFLSTVFLPPISSVPDSFFSDHPVSRTRPLPNPAGLFPTGWSDLFSRTGIQNHPLLSPLPRNRNLVNDTISLIYSNFSPTFPEIFNDTKLFDDIYRRQRQAEHSLLRSADVPILADEQTTGKDRDNAETTIEATYTDQNEETGEVENQKENEEKKLKNQNEKEGKENEETGREESKKEDKEMNGRNEEEKAAVTQEESISGFRDSNNNNESFKNKEGNGEMNMETLDKSELNTVEPEPPRIELDEETNIDGKSVRNDEMQFPNPEQTELEKSFELSINEDHFIDNTQKAHEDTSEEKSEKQPITTEKIEHEFYGGENEKKAEERRMSDGNQNGETTPELKGGEINFEMQDTEMKGQNEVMKTSITISEMENESNKEAKEIQSHKEEEETNQNGKQDNMNQTKVANEEEISYLEEEKEINTGKTITESSDFNILYSDKTKNNEVNLQEDINKKTDHQERNEEKMKHKKESQILSENKPGELLSSDFDVIHDNNATNLVCSSDGTNCWSTSKSILMTTGILIGIIVGLVTIVGLTTGLSVYTFHHWKLRRRSRAQRSCSINNIERAFSPTPYMTRRPLYENEGVFHDNDSPVNTLEAITVENYRENAI